MFRPGEQRALLDLYHLLRNNGDRIVSGEGRLSLTTSVLALLQHGFTMICSDDLESSFTAIGSSSESFQLLHQLQFLHDVVQKTRSLKLIHDEKTVQGMLSLSRFTGLAEVEIKKVPLHLLEGLRVLKPRLAVIICSRSLPDPKILFETCGGDNASPSSWPKLKAASLSRNKLKALDGSLRLLPVLEELDVSHNDITDTQRYLEYLTELKKLNISFNRLSSLPTFNITCSPCLTVLLLRANCLDTITGVELLTGLAELDVAFNCLTDHAILAPLCDLPALRKLWLNSNPLAQHKHHRLLTLRHVAFGAREGLVLDDCSVTQAETRKLSKLLRTPSSLLSSSLTISTPGNSAPPSRTNTPTDVISSVYSFGDSDAIAERIRSNSNPRRLGRKGSFRRKKRRKEAFGESDLETSVEVEGEEEDMKEGGELRAREHIEELKARYGPNWLANYSRHQLAGSFEPRGRTNHDDDIYLQDTGVEDNTGTSSQQVGERPAAVATSSAPLAKLPADEAVPVASRDANSVVNGQSETERPANGTAPNGTAPNGNHQATALTEAPPRKSEPQDSGHPFLSDDEGVDEAEGAVGGMAEDAGSPKTPTSPGGGEEEEKDLRNYGPESEPFIVRRADSSEPLIVATNDRYLLEKDINGRLRAELDLFSILSCNGEREGEDLHLRLTFDYVRKDRRQRIYVVEDEESLEELMELLEPFLQGAKSRASPHTSLALRCLRCQLDFTESEAEVEYLKTGEELETKYFCPHCNSDKVITLDRPAEDFKSLTSSPVGSYSSAFSSTPIAPSPLAASTPSHKRGPSGDETLYHSLAGTDEPDLAAIVTSVLNVSPASATTTQSSKKPDTTDLRRFSLERNAGLSIASQARRDAEPSRDYSINTPPNSYKRVGSGSHLLSRAVHPKALDRRLSEEVESGRLKGSTNGDNLQKLDRAKRPSSGESDIEVLNVSGTNLAALGEAEAKPNSPPSSLNSEALHSMVSSVYEQSLGVNARSTNPFGEDYEDEVDEAAAMKSRGGRSGNPFWDGSQEDGFSDEDDDDDGVSFKSVTDDTGSVRAENVIDSDDDDFSIYDGDKLKRKLRSAVPVASTPADAPGLSKPEPAAPVARQDMTSSVQTAGGSRGAEGQAASFFVGSVGDDESLFGTSFKSTSSEDFANRNVAKARTETKSKGTSQSEKGDGQVLCCHDNYGCVDHRLKLYLDMHILNAAREERVIAVIQCGCVQWRRPDEFLCLLVVTDTRILLYSVIQDFRLSVGERLQLLDMKDLRELCYVDTGLGKQSFRLEFATEGSSFNFLVRDSDRCTRFLALFVGAVNSTTFSEASQLKSISKSDIRTWSALKKLIEGEEDEGELSEEDLGQQANFFMCHRIRNHKDREAASLVVTEDVLCLAHENHQHPLPRLQLMTPQEVREAEEAPQFTLLDRRQLDNVASLEVFSDSGTRLNVIFFDDAGGECMWEVTMETRAALKSLVTCLQRPWEQQFGVDLQITVSSVRSA